MDILPDNKTDCLHLFVLDPLSVIIKLAILSNKPVGTKLRINHNIIMTQEPGPFQALCRYVFKNNKSDMTYLHNPIELACQHYLTLEYIRQNPKIKELFKCAQKGLEKLIETYKSSSVMRICLGHYSSLITNHLEDNHTELFKRDGMSPFYTAELLNKMNGIWTSGRIKLILDLTTYLSNDSNADTNVKSLETIMDGIDREITQLLS